MIELTIGFVIGCVCGLIAGLWVKTRDVQNAKPSPTDEALIVTFLSERGPDDVLGLRVYMKDVTRGQYDWMLRDEETIYRVLNRLEAEGTIRRVRQQYCGAGKYELTAPRERLIAVS